MSRDLMRHLHLGCGEALNAPLILPVRVRSKAESSRAKVQRKAKVRQQQDKGA